MTASSDPAPASAPDPALPPSENRAGLLRVLAACRRQDLGWALLILALALGLRLAYAFQFAGHALGLRTWVDESAYWGQAIDIVRGQFLPSRPFTYAPLYPYVLAGMMSVFGPNVWALRIASACVGSLTPLAVFWAGRMGMGRVQGILAGLATAVYCPLIFYDAHLDKEVFAALGISLTLGLMAWAGRPERSAWAAGLTGWVWGVLALLRSHLMFLVPIGAAWWLLAIPGSLGRRLRRAAAYVAGFVLALAPVTLINAMVSNPTELILTSWVAGPNFYLGNGPEATGSFTPLSFILATPERESDDYVAEARRRTGQQLSLGEVSRYWMQQGLNRWRTDPGASVRLLLRKVAMLTNDFEIPDNHDLEIFRLIAAPALGWCILSFGWIAPWAALGLGVGRTDRTAFWWFLVLLTAGGMAATAIFFVVGRYRIPWIPSLMLLAAAGAVDTVRRAVAGQWRALAWRVLLLAVPAAILAWQPPPNPFPDRWSHFQVELALAYLDAGQLEQTINALDDARAMGTRPMQWTAMMLESGQDHDHLESVLMSRLEAKPAASASGSGSASSSLDEDLRRIRLLRQIPEGRDESRRLAEAALKEHPADPRVHREWGAWLLGEARVRDPRLLRAVRLRAAREFNEAAHGTAQGDASAEILLALVLADPIHLDHAAQIGTAQDQPRIRYARAFLAAGHP